MLHSLSLSQLNQNLSDIMTKLDEQRLAKWVLLSWDIPVCVDTSGFL